MKKAASPELKINRMENAVEERQEALGLCSCCQSLPTCTYTKDSQRPILQCEEFDGIVLSPIKTVSRAEVAPVVHKKNPANVMDKFAPYPGLCGLCENSMSCTYPKPEGGVWHCEEYK